MTARVIHTPLRLGPEFARKLFISQCGEKFTELGEAWARAAGAAVLFSMQADPGGVTQMIEDWKKTLPFPQHWASYLVFKLAILALAALAALHFLGYF